MNRPTLISTLFRVNVHIIQQKLDLISILHKKYGVDHVQTHIYNTICPIVQASIGQHIRHSNDHIERCIEAVSINLLDGDSILNRISPKPYTISYDTRTRNTNDEQNVSMAIQRLQHIKKTLQTYQIQSQQISIKQPVNASFILLPSPMTVPSTTTTNNNNNNNNTTSMTTTEPSTTITNNNNDDTSSSSSLLPSTIGRELGFVAHHAIHHLAMIQIIVTTHRTNLYTTTPTTNDDDDDNNNIHLPPSSQQQQPYLLQSELPLHFGKAPSTIHYLMKQQQQQQE